ncbi:MAG: HAD family hydrolase [Oscillospiraceae bacterium]|nr:HAD family hydrolase [Oscillospiraceae bacterium]
MRVAVENALDEIKTAADYICESHNEDGVVKWIENHIK